MIRRAMTILVAGLMTAPAAYADVALVQKVSTDGVGGFGASVKESRVWVTSDKRREEDKADKQASSFIGRMASGDGRAQITRLDKKLMWMLNIPRKTYKEMSLVPPKMEETKEDSKSKKEEGSQHQEKPTVRITKAEFTVTPGGNKKTINGFNCSDYSILTLLEMEDLETHAKSEMKMITSLWTAPETGDLAKIRHEEEAYAKSWRQAMGIELTTTDLKAMGGAMVAGLMGAGEKDLAKALAKMPQEMKKVKGYPIVTRVEWFSKNDESAAARGSEEAADDGEGEDVPDLSGGLGGALGSIASHAAKKQANKKIKERTTPKEGAPLFAMTTELVSVSAAVLPASIFEVPAGFKKTGN